MNRKEFIKKSTGAIASAAILGSGAISPLSASPEKETLAKVSIKKSLKWGMVKEDLSIMDKFKMLKDLGYDGVELDSPNDLDKKQVLAARDKTGLVIPGVVNSVHWKSPLSHADPKVRQACADSMKTALQDCKDYGGTTVLLVAGVVNSEISYDDAYRRSQDEIRKMIPWAHETGVKIAIENVWNNFLLSPIEAARFIDELNDPMVGWYFDIGNVVRYGWPEQWIKVLNRRIMKLDVKEYSRKKQSDEGIWKGFDVELLEGDNNWPTVMRALESIDYKGGWMSAEVNGGDRKRLQQISELMDKIIAL
ncbi:sugar phosphate isomerase/epimerase family protein [Imperialibacter roseus]|uniref:Sugar phosphate isomerase/epimerase family protein n=1 Tax=Imperialibacter roseus TaxID=1324217 RepID=A0ABZ0IXM9_9BACT|nr:sugar phosphate isomerase/epimerase family protein [Imperialibacter roseus]WOK09556.1 sugar phosphate isomerase/epimerase family protein [Imperialibacter roseus]